MSNSRAASDHVASDFCVKHISMNSRLQDDGLEHFTASVASPAISGDLNHIIRIFATYTPTLAALIQDKEGELFVFTDLLVLDLNRSNEQEGHMAKRYLTRQEYLVTPKKFAPVEKLNSEVCIFAHKNAIDLQILKYLIEAMTGQRKAAPSAWYMYFLHELYNMSDNVQKGHELKDLSLSSEVCITGS
ncbi:hypothetical protein ARMSODRAFT_982417 [Armillaria solidipes]|uniref:Uncharacterized protein n=1 Tax=Armillaria solidipes TaxID=1076256 RepID=A0A2H3B2T5_9AGAR|nr:hypothetical protein ARMSODRAFT_982417 [Armillaria solidipes]